ncbi:MAG: hypothetical protein ACTS1Z_00090 [Parasphingopyxis sp.]|uniref:LVIVD repeat-containing protein n=1 Tax=Parasphingopyxis sp. TaxID=1920299 RepID=UPI003F9F1429
MLTTPRILALVALIAIVFAIASSPGGAAGGETAVERDYAAAGVLADPAPRNQSQEEADAKSAGCITCHTATDELTMHATPAVTLGCTDCHGGNPDVALTDPDLHYEHPDYLSVQYRAHVLPLYPESWHWPASANNHRSYTLLNRESPEYIRFVNPSDYRVVREACGACHIEVIEAAERSLMATGAMLWGGASYNNGILPYKVYILGEAYTRDGEPAQIVSPGDPHGTVTPEQAARGALPNLVPLPTWHVVPPGDIFRVFERAGRNIASQFPEIGIPNIGGNIQRLEEPGRPDLRQSNRGPGTGLRVSIPVLNIHKTRLNDPFTWFMGTNDQPGDYRHSGCASCHVVYANDREPRHSLTWAQYGRDGQTATVDPTINRLRQGQHRPDQAHEEGEVNDDTHEVDVTMAPGQCGAAFDMIAEQLQQQGIRGSGGQRDDAHHEGGEYDGVGGADGAEADTGPVPFAERERGHPVRHAFTRSIPTAQCMNCHMHQPNMFLNSYLGYTMWDYESDAPLMWPREQVYRTAEQMFAILDRNPEMAAIRGCWGDIDFLRNVTDLINPQARDTQFADYHGHGWNFRAIFRRDRDGNFLDADGNILDPDDPELFRREGEGQFVDVGTNPGRSVHMMDIHAEVGMQCADCHFAQDSHGNGLIYGEVASAVEIACVDCHGTADDYPTLRTSGPAAPPTGTNLTLLRNPDGQRRFEWMRDYSGRRILVQRSIIDPDLEWEVSLVRDTVDRSHPDFNEMSARSKLMGRSGAESGVFEFGPGIAEEDRAHRDEEMACFTCHLSWTTSCGGCHLPIEANALTFSHHYDGLQSRNYATYNPQVARDQMFQLGRHQDTRGNIIAPVRSSSALVLSSTNINRERIYVQQPPIAASGYSSQAFAPHFPHTVRRTETKQCTDCHLSAANDNNAIMAQLLLQGTNFVNFVGLNAWVGNEQGFQAVRVTEWEEPQAVFGSYLHRYAFPDYWRRHVEDNGRELLEYRRGRIFDDELSGETRAIEEIEHITQRTNDAARCLQLRGEYMFVAEGRGGFQVYDVASVANKGFSERIVTAPFSPLGHDTRVDTTNATCMALPTNQNISPDRQVAMSNMIPGETEEERENRPTYTCENAPAETLIRINQEQCFHPIYNYAVITDSVEGLILVNVNTMADGELRNNFLRRAEFTDGTDAWNENGVLNGARHIVLGGHYAYIAADAGMVVIDLDDPLAPRHVATIPLTDARASALQFRYLWVTTAEGVQVIDVTDFENPRLIPNATFPLADARRLYIARTYAYIAAGRDGLVILDVENPEAPVEHARFVREGTTPDTNDVIVGTTNASLFAYVADGVNGMQVLQLTSPSSQPNFYGFSPAPVPELIAWMRTSSPALALSKGLDRDRGVDETGGQMAIFGRLGSRPFTRSEMERLFLNSRREPYRVTDQVDMDHWVSSAFAGR